MNVVVVATNLASATTNFVVVTTTNFVSHDITGLDVVDKVNGLYSSVFNMMLAMLGIAATFVVFVMPYIQRREGRLQEERISADFKAKMDSIKGDLENKILQLAEEKKDIEATLKEAEVRIEKNLARSLGAALQVQAVTKLGQKNIAEAVYSATGAALNFVEADDKSNLTRMLNLITDHLSQLTTEQIKEHKRLEEKLAMLETKLKEIDEPDALIKKIQKFFEVKKAALKETETK